jgi:hypothetical protein
LLWDFCYESGEDYVGTADDLESMVGWAGASGALAAALVDAGAPEGRGFIEAIDDTAAGPVRFRVHDLWDHVPTNVAKRRRRRADDGGQTADDGVRTADTVRQTANIGGRTANNGRRTASSVQKKDLLTLDLDLQIQSTEQVKERSIDPGSTTNALLQFPVVGRPGPTWALLPHKVAEWSELFPGLNVLGEAKQALAWVRANPGRRKTSSGMERFLVGWLTRSVNRGSGSQSRSATGYRASQVRNEQGPSDRDLELIAQYERGKAAS